MRRAGCDAMLSSGCCIVCCLLCAMERNRGVFWSDIARTDGRSRSAPTEATVAAATDRPQRGQPPLSVRVVRGARKPKDGRRDGRRDGGAHALGIHLGGGGAWRKRKKWAAKEGIAGPAAGPPGGEWVVNMKTISKIELKTRCWPPPRRKVKTVSHAQCTRTKPILKFWG